MKGRCKPRLGGGTKEKDGGESNRDPTTLKEKKTTKKRSSTEIYIFEGVTVEEQDGGE